MPRGNLGLTWVGNDDPPRLEPRVQDQLDDIMRRLPHCLRKFGRNGGFSGPSIYFQGRNGNTLLNPNSKRVNGITRPEAASDQVAGCSGQHWSRRPLPNSARGLTQPT
jgi:hypothetical protein